MVTSCVVTGTVDCYGNMRVYVATGQPSYFGWWMTAFVCGFMIAFWRGVGRRLSRVIKDL